MSKFNKLSRAEMRNVKGGDYPTTCTIICRTGGATGTIVDTVVASFCASPATSQCPGGEPPPLGAGYVDYASCSCGGAS